MENLVNDFITKEYLCEVLSVKNIGGGFYGKVYLAEIDKNPYKLVVKVYLFNNIAVREKEQLEVLAKCSAIRVPKVYNLHLAENDYDSDAIVMEY